MPIILLLLFLLALPLIMRLLRALIVFHLWTVILFLPAGLLLRFGRVESMAVYGGVTLAWAVLLVGWRLTRRD
jgi:hypothetical protein